MAARRDDVEETDEDSDRERTDEGVRRNRPCDARLLDATQVHDVISTRTARQIARMCPWSVGTAETKAPMPADIPTAALRM